MQQQESNNSGSPAQGAPDSQMEFEAFRTHKSRHSHGKVPHNRAFVSSKYRTKMCRNYLMGIPCPFEERCIYAHGEEQLRQGLAAANSTPAGNAGTVQPTVGDMPPSYESFVSVASTDALPQLDSPTDASPQYPTARFRHDPYSTAGMTFEP